MGRLCATGRGSKAYLRPARRRPALLALFAALLLSTLPVAAQETARVTPPDWANDTTYEFGIYDAAATRIATAYYRILKEESQGRPVYRLKYTAKNDQMSESSECVVDASTVLPLRSTRKVVTRTATSYWDVAYAQDKIIVRKKQEGDKQASEISYPATTSFFDYESLIWLVPQLQFDANRQARINVFDTLRELPTLVYVQDEGPSSTSVLGEPVGARLYTFMLKETPYKYWTVTTEDGREFPVRIDMGDSSFVNLRYKAKK